MGLLVASLSDRIDTQGRMLEQVLKTATEARAAVFAAEKATDWKRNGDLINEGIVRGNRQVQILATMAQGQREAMDRVLREMRPLIAITTPRELKRRENPERLRRRMPLMLAGAFVLGGGACADRVRRRLVDPSGTYPQAWVLNSVRFCVTAKFRPASPCA